MQTNAIQLGLRALLESLPGVTQVTFETSVEMIYRDQGHHEGDILPEATNTVRVYFDSPASFQRARKMTLVLNKIDELLRIKGNSYRVISIVPKVGISRVARQLVAV